jgi:hypothetical protein
LRTARTAPLRWIAIACLSFMAGCALTPEQQEALTNPLAADAQAANSSATIQRPAAKLMLFGGPGHRTYLGCLNCAEYATDSVLNQYGTHGSAYNLDSIFNQFGDYGSAYSQYSACNPYAFDAPVIVDSAGNFYGRLTVNAYIAERTHNETIVAWLDAVCAH